MESGSVYYGPSWKGNRWPSEIDSQNSSEDFALEKTKRILYLRRRALLMELALIEDELGIERSVKRK